MFAVFLVVFTARLAAIFTAFLRGFAALFVAFTLGIALVFMQSYSNITDSSWKKLLETNAIYAGAASCYDAARE